MFAKTVNVPLHDGSKTEIHPELPVTFTNRAVLTSDLLLIALSKIRLNSQMHTHCLLQYYIYMYR